MKLEKLALVAEIVGGAAIVITPDLWIELENVDPQEVQAFGWEGSHLRNEADSPNK